MVVLAALMVGPLVTAGGFLLRADVVVMAGSLLELVGALALLRHARRRRHAGGVGGPPTRTGIAMRSSSLLCAIGWFVVGTAMATWHGVDRRRDGARLGCQPRCWRPLALGWAAQALVGLMDPPGALHRAGLAQSSTRDSAGSWACSRCRGWSPGSWASACC